MTIELCPTHYKVMKKIFIFFIFCTLYFILNTATSAMAAASLSLSPTSQSAAVGGTFDVNVVLNTGGAACNSTDVILTYNPQIIKVQSVSFGASPLFVSSNVSTPDNTNGKLILNSSVMSSAFAYNGTGTLATITFKGEATGSSAVTFTCTAATTNGDTNVWNTQAQDIVSCSANIGGNYTITAAGNNPTATPAPGSGETPTGTPTPPVAGNSSLTVVSFVFGTFFLLGGVLFRYLFLKS